MEEWYTYKQIIKMLDITPQTLNNWRRNGKIRYKMLSKKTFLYQLLETKIIQENESSKNL
jgi:predicted site-specific integrase-resolvase